MITCLSDLNLNTIAIVDDDPENAETYSINVEHGGGKAITFTENLGDLEPLLQEVEAKANGVLCDHRLGHRTLATFTGARAVAEWFKHKFPAILVSSYVNLDMHTTIREWRRYIPVVIDKDAITKEAIIKGFADCKQELASNLPTYRKPRRAIVMVVDSGEYAGAEYIDAIVAQWSRMPVRFPKSLLGQLESHSIEMGMRFIADVNIGARSAEELFFENFELAPEPDPNNGLA